MKKRTDTNEPLLMEFFENQLGETYWSELKLAFSLGNMEKADTSEALSHVLTAYFNQTQGHAARLEQVFSCLGTEARAKRCDAMSGILAQGDEILADDNMDAVTREAALIFTGQKAVHYQIATYSALIYVSGILSLYEISNLLNQSIDEEKNTDKRFDELTKGKWIKAIDTKGR